MNTNSTLRDKLIDLWVWLDKLPPDTRPTNSMITAGQQANDVKARLEATPLA